LFNVKVYGITELGKKVLRSGNSPAEEERVLQYVKDYRTASDDALDVVADRWIVTKLVGGKLLKELGG
jgi:hypothetical protein